MIEARQVNQLELSSKSYQSFIASKYNSKKHSSYFQVYDEIFQPYVGKKITFVEVGVLNGGSLFMWRDFFGPEARIIGIELNPLAKKWEDHGFEIFIGSQADPIFWENFFKQVGPIDVMLDDGGHFNDQQIITTLHAIPSIKDGGLLVIEDVHTSYMPKFNNPSKYSFINFAKSTVDSINARFPGVAATPNELGECIFSVSFYESIVTFKINRKKCFIPSEANNNGITNHAKDFRKIDQKARRNILDATIYRLFTKIAHKSHGNRWVGCLIGIPLNNFLNRKLKRYF